MADRSNGTARRGSIVADHAAQNASSLTRRRSASEDLNTEGSESRLPRPHISPLPASRSELQALSPSASPDEQTRLDHIFDMLTLLDGGDEQVLRRVEQEILRAEENELRAFEAGDEHEIDQHILGGSGDALGDVANAHDELEALLSVLARGVRPASANVESSSERARAAPDRSARRHSGDFRSSDPSSMFGQRRSPLELPEPPRPNHERAQSALDEALQSMGIHPDTRVDEPANAELDAVVQASNEPENANADAMDIMRMTSDLGLSPMHFEIIHTALMSARHSIGLNDPLEPVVETPQVSASSNSDERRSRRDRNSSRQNPEPDEERDRELHGGHDDDQIEGYEGDRRAAPEPAPERRRSGDQQSASSRESIRLSQIMLMLRELSGHGVSAEEVDDHVLQAVLQLNRGPSSDSQGNDDHMGDEQVRIYQDVISVIDDFLELLAIQADDEEAEEFESGAVSSARDDADGDNLDSGRQPEMFVR